MNETREVRQAVDRILQGELEPMLALLANDVTLQVAVGGNAGLCLEDSGKAAVGNYFAAVRPMVAFWQMDYTARGEQLVAWGRESFTIEPCGLEAGGEFALVFDVVKNKITRLLVIEDLPAYFREGRTIAKPSRRPSVLDMVEHLAMGGVSLV